jgi:hypothetical protein
MRHGHNEENVECKMHTQQQRSGPVVLPQRRFVRSSIPPSSWTLFPSIRVQADVNFLLPSRLGLGGCEGGTAVAINIWFSFPLNFRRVGSILKGTATRHSINELYDSEKIESFMAPQHIRVSLKVLSRWYQLQYHPVTSIRPGNRL